MFDATASQLSSGMRRAARIRLINGEVISAVVMMKPTCNKALEKLVILSRDHFVYNYGDIRTTATNCHRDPSSTRIVLKSYRA